MLVVAIALGVLALVLLIGLIVTRTSLGAARSEVTALQEQVATATAEAERADAAASEARTQAEQAQQTAKQAQRERDAARAEVEHLGAQRAELATRVAEHERDLAEVRTALAEAEAQVAEAQDEAESATGRAQVADAAAASATAAAAEAEAALARLQAELADRPAQADDAGREPAPPAPPPHAHTAVEGATDALDPLAVWALETVRIDRLWRDQLAAGQDVTSPLATEADPTRGALQAMVEALRESAGTPVELAWEVDTVVPPGPGARLVRVAEELLAQARSADAAVLTVRSAGGEAGEDPVLEVVLRADPTLTFPEHLLLAVGGAGLAVGSVSETEVTVRVPWPTTAGTWEG